MLNRKLFFSLIIFSILITFTSVIKNKTRLIEKIYIIMKKKLAIFKIIYTKQS